MGACKFSLKLYILKFSIHITWCTPDSKCINLYKLDHEEGVQICIPMPASRAHEIVQIVAKVDHAE